LSDGENRVERQLASGVLFQDMRRGGEEQGDAGGAGKEIGPEGWRTCGDAGQCRVSPVGTPVAGAAELSEEGRRDRAGRGQQRKAVDRPGCCRVVSLLNM
jgi:hypothetical protein